MALSGTCSVLAGGNVFVNAQQSVMWRAASLRGWSCWHELICSGRPEWYGPSTHIKREYLLPDQPISQKFDALMLSIPKPVVGRIKERYYKEDCSSPHICCCQGHFLNLARIYSNLAFFYLELLLAAHISANGKRIQLTTKGQQWYQLLSWSWSVEYMHLLTPLSEVHFSKLKGGEKNLPGCIT